jgi:hypothetical protein
MSIRKLLTFNGLIWLGTVAVVVWLLGWPLVMNVWAASHWRQIPCQSGTSIPDQYLYVIDDTVYLSTHRDFWQMGGLSDRGVSKSLDATKDTCWVHPSDPRIAVHYLDAPRNWSNAGGRIVAAGLLMVIVAALTWADVRRRKKSMEHRP